MMNVELEQRKFRKNGIEIMKVSRVEDHDVNKIIMLKRIMKE